MSHLGQSMAARRALPIRAVTFDLDDTLWDTAEVIGAALEVFHAHIDTVAPAVGSLFGRKAFSDEMAKTSAAAPEIAHDFTTLRRCTLARCAETAGLPAAAIPPLVDGAFEAFAVQRSSPALWPAVLPALGALRERGLALAAITNGNADLQRIAELREVFAFCVTAAEAGGAKPMAAPFELAQQRLGIPKEQILHVGDDFEADVKGAKAAGYGGAVLVLNSFDGSGRERFPEADAIVRDMSELPAAVEQICQRQLPAADASST